MTNLIRQVWTNDEIANIMQAIVVASGDLTDDIDTLEVRVYKRGFNAALAALSAALSVAPPSRSAHKMLKERN